MESPTDISTQLLSIVESAFSVIAVELLAIAFILSVIIALSKDSEILAGLEAPSETETLEDLEDLEALEDLGDLEDLEALEDLLEPDFEELAKLPASPTVEGWEDLDTNNV